MADNGKIRYISKDSTDNPKLLSKMLSNGKESLILEYYHGYEVVTSKNGTTYKKPIRERTTMKLYLWQAPRTTAERLYNKETLEVAKRIRFEKQQELLQNEKGYRVRRNDDINIIEYYRAYVEKYQKKDIKVVKMVFRNFVTFLETTPEYERFAQRLQPQQVTKTMVKAFAEYLQRTHKNSGAKSAYARFRTFIIHTVDEEVIYKYPCKGVTVKADDQIIAKEMLTVDEVKQLVTTHVEGQNTEVRRAFIFCLYTGIRYCDVSTLTFANVDYTNKLLRFEQSKTKGHSTSSGVTIPLNDYLLTLIGQPSTPDNKQELIFKLPSHTACLKSLRQWVKQTGINKHITWHCARHSYAMNTLILGNDVKTVSTILGHSSIRQTEKYLRAVDELKQQAINSLPTFE